MSALEEFEVKNIENIRLKLDLTTTGAWLWSPMDNSVWSPAENMYLAGVEIINDHKRKKANQYFHKQEDMRFIADSKEDMAFLLKVIDKLQLENNILHKIILEAARARPGKHI